MVQARRAVRGLDERAASGGRSSRRTAADIVRTALREELVSLKLLPGDAISEKELALAHGVSRTPVREAILRLADEGLVEVLPQSGTFAARIPAAALPEAIIIRKALEQLTSRLAAERLDASGFAPLERILTRQRELAAAKDREGFHAADEEFHAELARAAGHPGIWDLIAQTKVQVDRYRRLTLPQEGRMDLVTREHKGILDAVRRGDGPEASVRMGAHLDRLLADLAEMRDLNPRYFV